jgi:hypothetical protein
MGYAWLKFHLLKVALAAVSGGLSWCLTENDDNEEDHGE